MSAPHDRVTVILGDPRLPDRAKAGLRFAGEDFEAFSRLKAALAELEDYHFDYLDDHAKLQTALLKEPPSFVLNLCDTGYRNVMEHELHVPALLELLDIPYSGAGPACLALCHDKALVRALAASLDIPVPHEAYVMPGNEETAARLASYPAIIKPNSGDGSVGITCDAVVRDAGEAIARLVRLRAELLPRGLLLQELLEGAEYSVGLVGNPGQGLRELPLLEVDYDLLDPRLPRILAYESKSVPDSPYWTQIRFRRARLDDDAGERLVGYSRLLFWRLGCRDYARFDFRAGSDGVVRLLDVNPNPAWCWDGKLNLMTDFAGGSYAELLRSMLAAARARLAAEGHLAGRRQLELDPV